MKRIYLGAVLLMGWPFSIAFAQALPPEILKPENRLVSVSKQFTVFGGTRQERSDLARRAEILKAGLLRELESRDLWRAPILLILTPGDGQRLRQPDVLVQVFNAGDAGRKIQMDISPTASRDQAALDAGILRALLLEWALRRQQFVGDRYITPPVWLAAALAAALAQRDASESASLYASLLETKGMPKLEKFLDQNPETLRGYARELHAAQSLALFHSLIEIPEGRGKILENLTLVEPAKDAAERFGQTWPDLLADPARMARLWALGIARLSSSQRVEMFSANETSEKLAAALRLLQTPEGDPDFAKAVLELGRQQEGRFLLEKAAVDLRHLGFRAHPLYVALVQEYQSLLEGLSKKKRKRFVAKFTEAEDLRHALDARSKEITAFMDSRQVKMGGEETLSTPPPQAPEAPRTLRNDGVSRFLDSVEHRGW